MYPSQHVAYKEYSSCFKGTYCCMRIPLLQDFVLLCFLTDTCWNTGNSVMMRHASMQVNHNQLKELQQVTKPQAHTHMQTDTHFFYKGGTSRSVQLIFWSSINSSKLLIKANQSPPTPWNQTQHWLTQLIWYNMLWIRLSYACLNAFCVPATKSRWFWKQRSDPQYS